MQLDYITIRLVVDELSGVLKGAQVREVVSQGSRSVAFNLWCGREISIIFSADSDNSRIHILSSTPSRSGHPDEHFHRMMRHHIAGSYVDEIALTEGERIVEVKTSRKEFSGIQKHYIFIAELMGRHSNLILTDEDGTILVADHTQMTRDGLGREIRPGKPYVRPPSSGQIPLKEFTKADFTKFLEMSDQAKPWGKLFMSTFSGITPGFIAFIAEIAGVSEKISTGDLDKDRKKSLHEAYQKAVTHMQSGNLFKPFCEILEIDKTNEFPVSQALANFFSGEIHRKVSGGRENQWTRAVEARIKSLEKLVANLNKDLEKAIKADEYRKMGDLIFAYMSEFQPGVRELLVDDILDPEQGQKYNLKLLPGKDAKASGQEYHKRASKLTRGIKEITKHLNETNAQLDDYRNLLNPPEDILESEQAKFDKALEDIKGGKTSRYVKKTTAEKEMSGLPKKLQGENIHHYRTKDGQDVFVGGNDKANEALMRWGNPDDLWLHVKNIPGSHVLVPRRGNTIEFDTILFAAELAVYHSKVKGATRIPVDYTLLKYVNKPSGSEPGFVIYKKEKNVLADSPDEKQIKKRKV